MIESAPSTLSREQFHRVRPHGSYSAYQRYVSSKRSQRANRPIDPFAPISERTIQQRASIFGPQMNDQQIQQTAGTEAHAQVEPLLKLIEDEISRRSSAEQQHLAGATRNYQQQVGQYAPQVQQSYGGAEQAQAGVNAALAQSLAGGGQQLAGDLSAKLGQINAPQAQVQQVAGGTAQAGVGAGNAQLGTGSAELSQLLAHGAAAQEYGAKLPGIAANEGLQRSGEIAGRYADELNQRTGEVTAQLPALIQNLVEGLQSRNENRQQNKAGLIENERNRLLQTGVFGKEYGLNVRKAKAATYVDRARTRESVRHNKVGERQRDVALNEAAAGLGISRGQLDARIASQNESGRHNRAEERHQRAAQNETRQHNRAQEQHQQAVEQRAASQAKAQGREFDPKRSAAAGHMVDKQGRAIYRWTVKDGKRVPPKKLIPYTGDGGSTGGKKGKPWHHKKKS